VPRETLDLGPPPPEQLDQQHAADIERLVHHCAHRGAVIHRLARDIAQRRAGPPGNRDEQRQHGHARQRQPPVKRDHDRQRAHELHEVGHAVQDGVADGLVRVAHVVVQAAHQLTGARVGEKAQRHALEMVVEVQAQVVGQPLADAGGQLAPPDAQPAADQRQRQQPQRQPVEPAQVFLRQRVVDQVAEDQRLEQAERGADQDHRQQSADLPAVRARVAHHPLQQRPGDAGPVPGLGAKHLAPAGAAP